MFHDLFGTVGAHAHKLEISFHCGVFRVQYALVLLGAADEHRVVCDIDDEHHIF